MSVRFDWSHLGDIEWGCPNLGPQATVAVYRLMQYTLRDAIIAHTDVATANRIFYDAGQSAGKAVHEHLLQDTPDFDGFIAALFSAHFGRKFTARETDCWCTGARVCRFEVGLADL